MQILDGRKSFTQWDKDVKIVSNEFHPGEEIHFDNGTTENALVLHAKSENGKVIVNVPNEFLVFAFPIKVYYYVIDSVGSYTKKTAIFSVEPRRKPDDYFYTPSEVYTVEKAVETALTEAKESGVFKGDPGKDYVLTEEDRNELVTTLLEPIPDGDEVKY